MGYNAGMTSKLSLRALLVAVATLACSCKFALDRHLEPGEIRGTLGMPGADGTFTPLPDARVRVEGSNLTVRSDQHGRFVLRHLTEGKYRLRMRHERKVNEETVVSALTADVKLANGEALDLGSLTLKGLGAIEGVVSRDDEPVTATVAIDGEAVAESDFAAGYKLRHLTAGRRTLAVQAMGEDGLQLYVGPTVDVLADVVTVADISLDDLELVPTSSISVRVRLGDNAEATGVDLELHNGFSMFLLPKAENGRWVSVEVPAGIYTLVAKKEGYLPSRLTALVISGETHAPDIILTPDVCRVAPGEIGCGQIAMEDSDGDGIPDHLDHCPDDPLNECAPGVPPLPDAPRFCGSGLQDRDGDGVCRPDCSEVSCGPRRRCNDETGTAMCECTPGHSGELCVLEGKGPSLVFGSLFADVVAGQTMTPVSVHFADAYANPATDSRQPVTLTLEAANGATIQGTTVLVPEDGVAIFSDLVIEKAGVDYTLVASAQDFLGVRSESFSVKPAGIDADRSTLSFNREDALADGSDSVLLTFQAVDAFGNVLPGVRASMRTDVSGDVLQPNSGRTDEAGRFVASLTSTTPGERVIVVEAGGHAFELRLRMLEVGSDGSKTTLSIDKESVVADGVDVATITVRVLDRNDRPIAGRSVVLSSIDYSDTITPSSGETNGEGVFSATIASTGAGMKVLYARADSIERVGNILFVAGPPDASESTVHAWETRLPADGVSAARLDVFIVDAWGNGIAGVPVSLHVDGTGNLLTQPEATDEHGGTHGTIASTQPGTKTITMSAQGIVFGATVELTFTPALPVGGTVSGLAGGTLVLTNNGDDSLSITENGPFVFARPVFGDALYDVKVATQPGEQVCSVVRGSGVMGDEDVTNVEVKCGSIWTQVVSGATAEHTLGIRSDGSLWAWGANESGQLGDGSAAEQRLAVPVLADKRFIAAAAGASHGVGIDEGGKLWAWGANEYGQLGDGSIESTLVPVPVPTAPATTFSAVSAGRFHTLAVDTDGAVWAWGRNEYGQLGDGSTDPSLVPKKNTTIKTKVVAVAAGANHSLALDENGVAWAWGRNEKGELGIDSTGDRHAPVEVPASRAWTAIAAGERHSVALDEELWVWTWGDNEEGQLGAGTSAWSSAPLLVVRPVDQPLKGASIAAGGFHTLVVDEAGGVWAWGRNRFGELGVHVYGSNRPKQIDLETSFLTVSAGAFHSVALGGARSLWTWGDNTSGQLGNGVRHQRLSPTAVAPGKKFSAVSAGSTHSLALDEEKLLWVWGEGNSGALGLGFQTRALEPTQVSEERKFAAGLARAHYTIALDEGGLVWAWGSNAFGVFGDGTKHSTWEPEQTVRGVEFTSLSSSASQVLGIAAGGALWAWGANQRGSLGNGSTSESLEPVRIKPEAAFIAVTASAGHSLAIDGAGNLWAWGSNGSGELGNDDVASLSSLPVRVSSDKSFRAVSAGRERSFAIDSDGGLWAWGANDQGQLGDGTTSLKAVPEQIMKTQTFTDVRSTASHTLALETGGAIWAWGDNEFGQLGDGTRTSRQTPVRLESVPPMSAISVGDNHSLALDLDGAIWAWGDNESGKLGTGEARFYLEPTFVP